MLQVEVVDELGDDLGVGVALEAEALVLQEDLHLLVVGDDPVVHDEERMMGVGAVRVRVQLAGDAVGGPARVSYAAVDVRYLLHVQLGGFWAKTFRGCVQK